MRVSTLLLPLLPFCSVASAASFIAHDPSRLLQGGTTTTFSTTTTTTSATTTTLQQSTSTFPLEPQTPGSVTTSTDRSSRNAKISSTTPASSSRTSSSSIQDLNQQAQQLQSQYESLDAMDGKNVYDTAAQRCALLAEKASVLAQKYQLEMQQLKSGGEIMVDDPVSAKPKDALWSRFLPSSASAIATTETTSVAAPSTSASTSNTESAFSSTVINVEGPAYPRGPSAAGTRPAMKMSAKPPAPTNVAQEVTQQTLLVVLTMALGVILVQPEPLALFRSLDINSNSHALSQDWASMTAGLPTVEDVSQAFQSVATNWGSSM